MAEADWKYLQYNVENGQKRTGDGPSGGSSTFAGLDDVNLSNLQNGQVPKYNSTTHKWENANESGGGGTVTDVTVDGVSVVNQQGVAEIEMPTPPTIPIEDVEVNGESVVNAQKVAEIKSYKEVTQAQYEALPDTKLTDGVMYCIKDVGGANQFPPLIYSDEEREIGVWRDGKPLYQKNFWLSSRVSIKNDFTTIIDSDTTAHSIENIVSGCVYDNNGGSDLKRVRLLTGDIALLISNSNQLIAWASTNSIYSAVGYMLQYTKTTDTPGSGTWTTQGALAHHYSTDEHIIGTWVDGKPLYEKTWKFGSAIIIEANVWTNMPISNSTIKNVIGVKGYNLHSGKLTCWDGLSATADTGNYVKILHSRNPSMSVSCLTLQYTKTTD